MKQAVIIVLALVVAYIVWDQFAVDSCLDGGGAWDWSHFECDG
jgi:hypothetical protein